MITLTLALSLRERGFLARRLSPWIPAFAGMTSGVGWVMGDDGLGMY